MPFADLSQAVPSAARWIKVRYLMRSRTEGQSLTARLWSGDPAKGVVVKGASGDAFVRLDVPQTLSFEHPDGVELSLKVVAYRTGDDPAAGPGATV